MSIASCHGALMVILMGSRRNILLTPVGSAGDNYPFIGLARELVRRGHAVSIATSGAFQKLVEAAGARFIQTGTEEEYRAIINRPELWHASRGFKTVLSLLGEQVKRLFRIEMEALQADPKTIIVSHSLDFVSRAMFDKFAMPLVAIHLQPTIMRTVYDMPVMTGTVNLSFLPRFLKRGFWRMLDLLFIDRNAGPLANDVREQLGLEPIRHPFDQYLNRATLCVGMWPAWFAAAQPDYPANFRQTGFPLYEASEAQPVSEEVEAFLAAGEAPVAVTPGSAHVFAHDFFRAAAEALRQTGRRGMLLTRHREQIPAGLPANVRHFEFAPLGKILPRCAALVHHGGIGTTAAALAGGVPQLICPMAHDQPDSAARIVRLGAGMRLMPRKFSAQRVATALEGLLNGPGVRERCRELAQLSAQDRGVEEACDWIERVGEDVKRRLSS